eukprot:TRINITY_DN19920_c0_g2_i1.p1 TRINITY_DN19920_c0_g2~~TRINITY_DN19920_c0_g2_i1.p1  ORF type:complete len:648 (+),score=154.14 TRINITY_DN19920_c0_g2_i1:80-1945(+)
MPDRGRGGGTGAAQVRRRSAPESDESAGHASGEDGSEEEEEEEEEAEGGDELDRSGAGANRDPFSDDQELPPVGCLVEVAGLTHRRTELNGCVGRVVGYDESRPDGVVVRFGSDGNLTKVLSANLIWPTAAEAARDFPIGIPVLLQGAAAQRLGCHIGCVEVHCSDRVRSDNRIGVALSGAPLHRGSKVIARTDICFAEGQRVLRGSVGNVLHVPGEQAGSVAEVSMAGLEFDAQPGEVAVYDELNPRVLSVRARRFKVPAADGASDLQSAGLRFFSNSLVLREVTEGSAAALAGANSVTGHRLLAVNGKCVVTAADVEEAIEHRQYSVLLLFALERAEDLAALTRRAQEEEAAAQAELERKRRLEQEAAAAAEEAAAQLKQAQQGRTRCVRVRDYPGTEWEEWAHGRRTFFRHRSTGAKQWGAPDELSERAAGGLPRAQAAVRTGRAADAADARADEAVSPPATPTATPDLKVPRPGDHVEIPIEGLGPTRARGHSPLSAPRGAGVLSPAVPRSQWKPRHIARALVFGLLAAVVLAGLAHNFAVTSAVTGSENFISRTRLRLVNTGDEEQQRVELASLRRAVGELTGEVARLREGLRSGGSPGQPAAGAARAAAARNATG